MPERIIVLQYMNNQRGERPSGLRVWSDGLVQRPASDNLLPGPTERLDVDRAVSWADERSLDQAALSRVLEALRQADFPAMPPKQLISYCKDDPGAGVWQVTLDNQTYRTVVYDPRPRRNAALDAVLAVLDAVLA